MRGALLADGLHHVPEHPFPVAGSDIVLCGFDTSGGPSWAGAVPSILLVMPHTVRARAQVGVAGQALLHKASPYNVSCRKPG